MNDGPKFELFLRLEVQNGDIVEAAGWNPETKEKLPVKRMDDLTGVKMKKIHGLGISICNPECVVIPVKIMGKTYYVQICPPF